MQTIVNLVSAGLGLAWVPQSVTQLRRPGVVYRQPWSEPVLWCETSLVWPQHMKRAAVLGFVAFVREQLSPHPA